MNTSELPLSLLQAGRRVLDSRPSCTVGRTTILIVGSTICTTSSPIPVSFWSPGIGLRETRAHVRPESTE